MKKVRIEPVKPHQIMDAVTVICAGDCEIYRDLAPDFYGEGDVTPAMIERVRRQYIENGVFDDTLNVEREFFENGGTFLVLLEDEKVVGTGAIKRIDSATAELCSMWFLPEYRGHGFGGLMVEQLLDFARRADYLSVRLDTSERCVAAVRLFRKMGFTNIERYKESYCTTIFLEKKLV